MSILTPTGVQAIKDIVDKTITSGYPGIALSISNGKGDDLLTYAAGTIGSNSDEPLSKEHLFWGASTSKLITAIAVLQLIEQGKLDLDDQEQLYALCPELRNVPIATRLEDGAIKLTPRKNVITLRRLLTHTSGLEYPTGDKAGGDFFKFFGLNVIEPKTERDILPPLSFEPGTAWSYGPGIDWAGFALERATGMKLGDYIKKFVAEPCGIEQDLTFTLTEEQKARLVKMNYRDTSGGLSEGPHLYSVPVNAKDGDDLIHSGGAGTFSRPAEYIKILSMILNKGVSPQTGQRVLKPETVDLMFVNQIPQWPNFIHDDVKKSGNGAVFPESGAQGWGISWFLTETPADFKRGVHTGHWSGMPNILYWCDKEKDVAGIVYGQVLPFNDKAVIQAWRDVEDAVYDNLQVYKK